MATKLEVWREALRLIGEHDIASDTEDVEARYVLEGAWDRAITYCLSLGWWRFAMATAAQTATTSSAVPGYSHRFAKPVDWHRTHSVGVISGTRLLPTDWREEDGFFYVKYSSVTIKYCKTAISPAVWPEVFAALVAAWLALQTVERISQSPAAKASIAQIFEQRLALCRQSESETPPFVMPEHAVEFAARHILEQGFWRHSVRTVQRSHDVLLTPSVGFSAAANKPADFLRVYDISLRRDDRFFPIDWREDDGVLNTKWTPFVLRYVSTDAIAPTEWPEGFRQAVDAYLAVESARAVGTGSDKIEALKAQFDRVLDQALAKDGLPRPMRLPEGAVERAIRTQLEQGIWRFATVTVELDANASTPAIPHAYSFDKPADWMRTIRVFRQIGTSECDVDFRDEGGDLHADYDPIVLRYVSTDAYDPDNWTELFTRAFFALLRVEEAKAANLPEGEVQARFETWRRLVGEAILKDGVNERPKVNRVGVFTAARRGYGIFGPNREQGW